MTPAPEPSRPAAPPFPVAEIERRLRWRFVPVVLFLAMLAGLSVAAGISLLAPRPTLTGLPDDPDVRAAAALVEERFAIGTGPLHFRSALTGEARPGWPFSVSAANAAAEAEALLERARARQPLEARILAAQAHLDLGRRKLVRAEQRYRRALELVSHYGEARLGLGVSLALRAESEGDPLVQRALRLQAVAQLAAVRTPDPVYSHALYDRALLLAWLGRRAEAARWARAYILRDPGSARAESLAVAVGLERP